MSSVEQLGYNDAKRGLSIVECPYFAHSASAKSWQSGHMRFRAEQKAKQAKEAESALTSLTEICTGLVKALKDVRNCEGSIYDAKTIAADALKKAGF